MKVGTDGVLLGAWFDIEMDVPGEEEPDPQVRPHRILDIGTGCGLIALMAAQRVAAGQAANTDAVVALPAVHVDAIDIDRGCIADAQVNVSKSPWGDAITLWHKSLDEFAQIAPRAAYDRIVSNPPYFSNSLLPPDRGRATARHTFSLSLTQLVSKAAGLLKSGGLLSAILPVSETEQFMAACISAGLCLHRMVEVRPFAGASPKRALLEAGFAPREPQRGTLTIHEANHEEYTAEYRSLTKEFYLKF